MRRVSMERGSPASRGEGEREREREREGGGGSVASLLREAPRGEGRLRRGRVPAVTGGPGARVRAY